MQNRIEAPRITERSEVDQKYEEDLEKIGKGLSGKTENYRTPVVQARHFGTQSKVTEGVKQSTKRARPTYADKAAQRKQDEGEGKGEKRSKREIGGALQWQTNQLA